MIDAVVAPVFRYFATLEAGGERNWFEAMPRVRTWRAALAGRTSVRQAVLPDFSMRMRAFMGARGSELSRRIEVCQDA